MLTGTPEAEGTWELSYVVHGGDGNRDSRVDSGRGQDRTLRGMTPIECATDGWS